MSANNDILGQWIEKADHDLGSAKLIFLHIPDYFDTIAFHCQQAVEKYLIALLIFHDINFRKSHSLLYLLDLLSQKINIDEDKYDKAIQLNSFGVQIRYPDKTIYLSKEELERAIEIAEEFRLFSFTNMGIEE